jgi:hypothetical protein
MQVDHWMTFGTFAEQRYFTYPEEHSYKGVIINANMLAHAPAGLAAFISGKTRPNFPFIIDPLTHAFQLDKSYISNKNGDDVKSSIKNLANEYGRFISNIVGKRAVIPDDFLDIKVLEEFVNNCINFQIEKLTNAIKDTEYYKYLEEFGEEVNKPYALVAPYFYMEEITIDDWLPLLVNSVKIAVDRKNHNKYKIFASIVINQGILLESDLIEKIIDTFHNIELDGFLVWIDELDETNTNRAVLKGFLKLCTGLRYNGNKEVINLHGGYFSLLASSSEFGQSAFSGVAHGPEFGEFRKIVPVGGGIPIAKFYIKQLHARVNYREALNYFNSLGWLDTAESYYSNVCDCKECREVIQDSPANFTIYGIAETKQVKRGRNLTSMEYAVKETKEHCLKHYLCRKQFEYENVSKMSKNELLEDLKNGEKDMSSIAPEAVLHLKLWQNVLSSNK